LQRLEDELGVILIERGNLHVALSEVGERVVAQARKSLEEVGRLETVAQSGKDPLAGTFRLVDIHTIAPYLLPNLIPALRQVAPGLTLYIQESMTALLADYLKYGTIDAAIIALPFDTPGIDTQALYDEVFEAVVPQGYPWVGRAGLAAQFSAAAGCRGPGAGGSGHDQIGLSGGAVGG